MDSYEATRMVFSRIQGLNPENASKIMGYLLLQDHGEKEMTRLAFGPDALFHNLIFKAKNDLGLSFSSPTTPISRPNNNPLSKSSSLSITMNNCNTFEVTNNPSSPISVFPPDFNPISPSSNSSRSYASMVNGNTNTHTNTLTKAVSGSFYSNCSSDVIDEYQQLQEQLSFLTDSNADEVFDNLSEQAPNGYNDTHLHRRSYSVPGVCFGSEDPSSGYGWKPCLYFARGFCKNGSSCKFLHGDSADFASIVGSPSKLSEFEQCQELIRAKAAAQQQQKLAAASQLINGPSSFPYNKCMNFFLQQQQQQQIDSPRSPAAAALMMGDELNKFGRFRMGYGDAMNNPGSRQIYLTFPADSTFREEDVSNYFGIYGPVQDVRIPYQQKRMFGFVTFVYSDTVKLILAKGNPHFVCDSRVLVKPYKEKGKLQEKKQQCERGEYFSGCPSPSSLDSRDPIDLHLGARMFYSTQEMLLRRKLDEQADLQQAIELQGRRLMNLQLLDLKNQHNLQFRHGCSPISSPTLTAHNFPLAVNDQEISQENGNSSSESAESESNSAFSNNNGNVNGNTSKGDENKCNGEDTDLHESFDHILPDNLFASPKKSTSSNFTAFSTSSLEAAEQNNTAIASGAPFTHPTIRSCFLQMPSFSTGPQNIGI